MMLALLATEVMKVAALSIRSLDDHVVAQLRVRAAQHGRSMEAEVRAILTDAAEAASGDLFVAILDRFSATRGVELALPERSTAPRAADLAS